MCLAELNRRSKGPRTGIVYAFKALQSLPDTPNSTERSSATT
jgi:hypothetical protein